MVIIKTKKCILRNYRKNDILPLQKNANNKKIYRNITNIPYPYTMKDAKSWVERRIKLQRRKNPRNVIFVIEVDGKFAGTIGLHKIRKSHKAEVGYWLGEGYWNRGIMTEALKGIEKYGFNELNLKRLFARVLKHNKGSSRVLEKCGYELEGERKKDIFKNGKYYNSLAYSKVR